jgi:galactokinase
MAQLSGWHRYAYGAAVVTGALSLPASLVISSTLPSEGGLSSSSALTVALVGVLTELLGETTTTDDLVALAVNAERLTGVEGGTMDQNVIVRAQAGTAMRIRFNPTVSDYVSLPAEIAVVAAHSGVTAAKGEGAKAEYNSRVACCRAAATELGNLLGIASDQPLLLGDVYSVPGCRAAVEEMSSRNRTCAEHVLSEASRVDKAVEAIRASDGPRLGLLFDESHESLRRFGVTVPELDAVAAAMKSAGAYGARLTGAGFGGYAISVCSPQKVGDVVAQAIKTGGGPAMRVWPSEGLT